MKENGRDPDVNRVATVTGMTGALEDDDVRPGWGPEIDELVRRRRVALEMGGSEAVARQHAKGKWDVRQRLDAMFDPDSFHEVGSLAGTRAPGDVDWDGQLTPSNLVVGSGLVDGRRVVASGDDYSVRNGTSEQAAWRKLGHIEHYAVDMRMPVVRFVDMSGASLSAITDQGYTSIPDPGDWEWLGVLSEVPVATVACGPCPGLGAWRVGASHFSVQVDGIGNVFAAGPPIVRAGIGEVVTAQDLGGSAVHAGHSGVIDNRAVDEGDAVEQVRRFLSYLPSSVHGLPQRAETSDDPDRRDEQLLTLIPRDVRRGYRVQTLLDGVFDHGSVFQIGAGWGRSSVVGLARVDGYPVGYIANDPFRYGGGMDEFAAEKVTRHIDLCNAFHLPIVSLVDQPGTVIGSQAERRGTVRKGLRALAAVEQSTVPWFAVVIRRMFGLGGATQWPVRSSSVKVAWPSARWGSMPVEGGVDALMRRQLAAAEDPDSLRRTMELEFKALGSPLRTAEKFGIHDVIDPRDTRSALSRWVADAYGVLTPGPVRHGHRP